MISVIIAVYNSDKWLHRCVDSILNQTYTDIELILVDDGSTDTSAEICDTYANNDKRVRVFHKANGGVSSARELGLSKARGEYIGWVDSDDYVDIDMYEKLYEAIKNNNAEIAYCDREECFSNGVIKYISMPDHNVGISQFMKEYFNLDVHSLCCTLVARHLYQEIPYQFADCEDVGEDKLISCQLYCIANAIVRVPCPFYKYIIRDTSLSKELTVEKQSALLKNKIMLAEFLKNTNLYGSIKKDILCDILNAKGYILCSMKDVTRWYQTCPESNDYIFANCSYGIKKKIVEYTIVKLYRAILTFLNIKM